MTRLAAREVDQVSLADRLGVGRIVGIEPVPDEDRLDLRIAVDYSARETMLIAAQRLAHLRPSGEISREAFAAAMNEVTHAGPVRDVDLLIRTGGEQRLSDFLLWECAYAELYFTSRMWPEFTPSDLMAAVREFHARERRFGGVRETNEDEAAVVAEAV